MKPDTQKKMDDQSTARKEPADVNPNKQGISNRPGDEEPESGVDREPGPRQTKQPGDRSNR